MSLGISEWVVKSMGDVAAVRMHEEMVNKMLHKTKRKIQDEREKGRKLTALYARAQAGPELRPRDRHAQEADATRFRGRCLFGRRR